MKHEGSRQQFPQEHKSEKLIMGLQKFFECKKFLILEDITAFIPLEETKNTMKKTALRFNFAHMLED